MHGRERVFATALLLLLFLVSNPASVFAVDFGSPVSYPVGTAPTGVVVADFNGDGKLDLAVANSGSGNVSILLGDGDGTFHAAVNFDSGVANPASLSKDDFNDDGKLDLAVFQPGDTVTLAGAVSVLLGNGDGSFQTAKTLALTTGAKTMAVADFNLDGKSDLAVRDDDPIANNASISTLLGKGDGTFQPAKQTSLPSGGNASLAAADLSGDGKPDLAVSSPNSVNRGVDIFLGNGDGTFQQGTSLIVPDISLPPFHTITRHAVFFVTDLRMVDVNHDGKEDVVVMSEGFGVACLGGLCSRTPDRAEKVSLFLGSGGGSFQEEQAIAVAIRIADSGHFQGSQISGLFLGDFNGDEKLDVGYTRHLLPNNATSLEGRLGKGDGLFSPILGFGPGRDVAGVADLNSDKNGDLVVFEGEDSIGVALNTSPATGADLGIITAGADPNPAGVGTNLTYTANVLNEGPKDATGVTFIDRLPNGVNFVSAVATQGSCIQSHLEVTCDLSSLASAIDATVTIVVAPTATGTITNAMSVSATEDDLVPANNSATQSTTVVRSFTLTVAKSGAGSGTVTSGPAGINCPGTCSALFAMGTTVSLSAAASADSTFTGWSGACTGTDACSVTMNANRNVTATFVPAPDFSLSAVAPSPTSVTGGHSATSTVTINSVNSFNSEVQFACSVDPVPALAPACSLNPASATPTANGSASSTLTINTTAPTLALVAPAARAWLYALWLPIGGLAWLGTGFSSQSSRKKMLAALLLCVLLVAGAVFQASCGGSSAEHRGTPGTPRGTYTITVTGTAGATTHSTSVLLTVQ